MHVNTSAVRGADPRSVWLTEAVLLHGRSTADQWLNWTKAEEGSISNNYQCKHR